MPKNEAAGLPMEAEARPPTDEEMAIAGRLNYLFASSRDRVLKIAEALAAAESRGRAEERAVVQHKLEEWRLALAGLKGSHSTEAVMEPIRIVAMWIRARGSRAAPPEISQAKLGPPGPTPSDPEKGAAK